jgi:enoyl-CoA hydratase/carnithine racemase
MSVIAALDGWALGGGAELGMRPICGSARRGSRSATPTGLGIIAAAGDGRARDRGEARAPSFC